MQIFTEGNTNILKKIHHQRTLIFQKKIFQEIFYNTYTYTYFRNLSNHPLNYANYTNKFFSHSRLDLNDLTLYYYTFDTYDSIRKYKVLETCDPSSFPTLISNVNPPRAVRILLVCTFCVIPGTLCREERSFLHDILDKQLTKRY